MTTSSTSPRSCADPSPARRLGPSGVLALWTGRGEGDQRLVGLGAVAPVAVPASFVLKRMRQVHGAKVLLAGSEVGTDLPPGAGYEPWRPTPDGGPPEADALLATSAGFCLTVLSADCVTVALGSAEGTYGAVHVGWRSLFSGVVESALAAMRSLGSRTLYAGLGPCIHPCCYEFDGPELRELETRYGPGVRSLTREGRPALDLPRAVKEVLRRQEVRVALDTETCTGCAAESYFSHRSRGEAERQALFVWHESISDDR